MYLLPAIDILEGHAVRLAKGDYAQVTVYNDDPVDQARAFESQGATWIHVVDLDGARTGVPENIAIVERIVRETSLSVEVGGGIRTADDIRRMLLAGSFLLPVILCVHFIHDKYKLSGWQTRGRLSRT